MATLLARLPYAAMVTALPNLGPASMNTIAFRVQPTTVFPSRALRALGVLLFSLLLVPSSAFAEEPAVTPGAATAEQAAPVAPATEETPAAAALREKLAALGPDASAEQIRETTRQTLEEQGASAEDIAKALEVLSMAEELGNQLSEAALDDADAAFHDLSPWGMYQSADVVVKSVMIGLVLASILTWTIWIAKSIELIGARRRLKRELLDLKGTRTLNQAAEQARTKHSFSTVLIEDAREELKLSVGTKEKEGLKERISFRQERLVAACGREMSKGTGVLATIGSTAPFVGLFGTVWGIMNSFIGIAKTQTTNLAVVAPGIAEALLATALGLVAAIPAVIIYNVFARSIASYRAQVADASAQVLLLVSRDLDHQSSGERGQQPHMVKAV